MAFRVRGRGQFTAAESRSGRGFVYSGRRVNIGGNAFQLNWNGPQLTALIMAAVQQGLSNLSDEALAYMQSIVPVKTGALRDSCFAIVQVGNTGRIQVIIGASTPYAVYVELGTRFRGATPYIRPTYDYVIRQLPELLKREVASRGR